MLTYFYLTKKNYEPRKNLNRLIRAICYGREENVETTLWLAKREETRTHEKGTRLVGICASSKGPEQAREISAALENPVLLEHKNVIKYEDIIYSGRWENKHIMPKKLPNLQQKVSLI